MVSFYKVSSINTCLWLNVSDMDIDCNLNIKMAEFFFKFFPYRPHEKMADILISFCLHSN